MGVHGGDIYRNRVRSDFSINVNPLGMPEEVKKALHEAVRLCGAYPDIEAEKLKKAVGRMQGVPEQELQFGNGASELFLAAVHGIRPKKTLIPVPSFYGYEHAAHAADGGILYYEMRKEDGFSLTKDFYRALTQDVELLFLANPNNPTGRLLSRETVYQLLEHCRDRGIYVILDECFIEFSGSEYSMLPETGEFDNLIVVRAFTKIFSIPGVRLGYLACGSRALLQQIKRHLPEWNLSVFAQAAGCACAAQTDFILKTKQYAAKEREFLTAELRKKGFEVFPSRAAFILLYSRRPLYAHLLEKGILIRDCSNFRGLCPGFYRIAVKSRKENEMLLEHL